MQLHEQPQAANFSLSPAASHHGARPFERGQAPVGVGAGKITFNPLTFKLGRASQWMASGTGLAKINLIGCDRGANGSSVQVIDDAFKLVGVKSDAVDASTGTHQSNMAGWSKAPRRSKRTVQREPRWWSPAGTAFRTTTI